MANIMSDSLSSDRSGPQTWNGAKGIPADGSPPVTLPPMTARDRDEVLAFVQSLPEEDLLFLSLDLTRPEAVDHWVSDIADGRIVSILAHAGGHLVGYASLHHNQLRWMRHLGEIRMQVRPA